MGLGRLSKYWEPVIKGWREIRKMPTKRQGQGLNVKRKKKYGLGKEIRHRGNFMFKSRAAGLCHTIKTLNYGVPSMEET